MKKVGRGKGCGDAWRERMRGGGGRRTGGGGGGNDGWIITSRYL